MAGGIQGVEGEIQRLPIMGTDEHVADFSSAIAFAGEICQGVKIAQALAHFPAIHHQMGDVEPLASELAVGGAATLRDFVFVMRENQIDSAAVNVEVFAEVFEDHRAAFEVPTRASLAPGAGPMVCAVLVFAGFPEGEVSQRVLAVFVVIQSGGRLRRA